jgi:hypothetical protein
MLKRLSIFIVGIALSWPVYAQQGSSEDNSKLSDIVARLQSGDLHTGEAAFNDLMTRTASEERNYPQPQTSSDSLGKFLVRHPDQGDQIKLGLVHLLATENHLFIQDKNPPADAYTDDDLEHYKQLVYTVASLNDERVIPVLVGAMTTGGIAERGLLKYGEAALGPLREALTSSDALVRARALGISLTILKQKKDPASHAQVLSLINKSLKDPALVVRGHAVQEIDCLDDRKDFVSVLEQIAKNDPDQLLGKALDGGDGDQFYPVRADARRALRDIQSNTGCGHSSAAKPKG